MSVLELKAVKKSFGSGSKSTRILKSIDFKLNNSEVICLIGPSGSGKTTFLQIAGLLDYPTSGSVIFEGKNCSRLSDAEITEIRGRKIGFIYQFHNLLPELTAIENAMLPLLIHGKNETDAYDSAKKLLAEVGLSHKCNSLPHELSGGEQQRVAIIRALITQPNLILADEPTGNLDQENAENVISLIFKEVRARGLSTIIVTHNPGIAKKADKILNIMDGKLHSL